DTVAAVTVSWQQVIDKYPGLRGPLSCAELRRCMGFNMDDIGAMIFPNVEEKCRTELLDECVAAEHAYLRQNGASLFPGVRETLPILADKCKLAIISNCESGYIECFWEITGLGRYFSDSECYGDTGLEKAPTSARSRSVSPPNVPYTSVISAKISWRRRRQGFLIFTLHTVSVKAG
ncbi:MAG: HAD family hydrolase, partial [Firmicutes bacterium]|nr:HAD family hydrolase [Bacillota bacterium]